MVRILCGKGDGVGWVGMNDGQIYVSEGGGILSERACRFWNDDDWAGF